MSSRRIIILRVGILLLGCAAIFSVLFIRDPAAAHCVGQSSQALPRIETMPSISEPIQRVVEKSLADIVQQSKSTKGLVVVQHIASGRIAAIASQEGADNKKCFNGWAEAFTAWEPGSVMKTLNAATALNERRLSLHDQFYNPGELKFGDDTLLNAINIPKGQYSYQDMISESINIGAVEALKKLSDKDTIDMQARKMWYTYLTERFLFGRPTGAFDHEQPGYIPTPNGYGSTQLRYAFMSFGIGLTLTPVQLTSAYAAVVNQGLYVSPTLEKINPERQNGHHVISPETSTTVEQMLETAAKTSNQTALRPGYIIGGKSGTGPSSDLTGTYQYHNSIGTYIGFIGKSSPEYLVLMKLDEPKVVDTLAGAVAAKAWAKVTGQIIDTGLIH